MLLRFEPSFALWPRDLDGAVEELLWGQVEAQDRVLERWRPVCCPARIARTCCIIIRNGRGAGRGGATDESAATFYAVP